jgi:hypothetical protein
MMSLLIDDDSSISTDLSSFNTGKECNEEGGRTTKGNTRQKGRSVGANSQQSQPSISHNTEKNNALAADGKKTIKINSSENEQKQKKFEQINKVKSATLSNTDKEKAVPQSSDKSQKLNSSVTIGGCTDDDSSLKHPLNKTLGGRRLTPKVNKRTASQEGPENQKLSSKKRRREKGEDGRRRKKKSGDDDTPDSENWVQCERCMKWRLIPSVDNLPEKWYCELNVTDLLRNSCDAPEQVHEEVAKQKRKNRKKAATLSSNRLKRPKSQSPTTVSKRSNTDAKLDKTKSHRSSPVAPKIYTEPVKTFDSGDEYTHNDDNNPRSRAKLLTVRSDEETRGGGIVADDAGDSYSSNKIRSNKRSRQNRDDDGKGKRKGRKPKEEKQQEWVQCEKCEKWRRLPSHISAKDLPENWFCSMNTWDPRSNSCAVQDDFKAVEDTSNIREGIMGGTHKPNGGNRLTYRDLILNRKQNRSISERTRAAESIFSSHAGEHDGEVSGPPFFTYRNSSAFQQKLSFNRTNNPVEKNPEETAVSLFTLMNHSKLWKDLCNGIRPDNNLSSVFKDPVKSCTTDLKAMVHYALSRGPMAAHEVLLECQCGEWQEILWKDLRLSCTIESMNVAIKQLEKDGLIEKEEVTEDVDPITNLLGMTTTRYKCVKIEGVDNSTIPSLAPLNESIMSENHGDNNPNDTIIENSRCMKISKPWKKSLGLQ